VILALVLVPFFAGLAAFALRADGPRRALLAGTACVHAVLAAACFRTLPRPVPGGWLALDPLGLLFLGLNRCCAGGDLRGSFFSGSLLNLSAGVTLAMGDLRQGKHGVTLGPSLFVF